MPEAKTAEQELYDDEKEKVNQPEQKTEKRELYDAAKGLVTRDGGPYFDDEERERAEIRRAKAEGREPDLENPGPTVGTQLVTYDLLDSGHASYPSRREVLDTPTRREELKPKVEQVVEVPAVTVSDLDPTHSSHGVNKAASSPAKRVEPKKAADSK